MPEDAALEEARLDTVARSFLLSRCQNFTENCFDAEFFLAWNDWCRVPIGVDTVVARNMSLTQRITELAPYCDVANGSCVDEDECKAQLANTTCRSKLRFSRFQQTQLQLRWWYSLRRESAFVARLLASCQLQGSATCERVVGEERAAREAIVLALRPSFLSALYGKEVGLDFPRRELESRPCGGKLPCLADLLAPALAAKSEAGVANAIVETQTLMEPDPQDSATFLAKFVRNVSIPFKPCGFSRDPVSREARRCKMEFDQISDLVSNLRSLSPWIYATAEHVSVLDAMFSGCWLNCVLVQRGGLVMAGAEFDRHAMRAYVVRYLRIMCDSQVCLRASSEAVQRVVLVGRSSFLLPQLPVSKLFAVMSIALDCALFVAGAAIAVLAIAVWKVARIAVPYIVMLGLTMLSIALDMSIYILVIVRSGGDAFGFILPLVRSVFCVAYF